MNNAVVIFLGLTLLASIVAATVLSLNHVPGAEWAFLPTAASTIVGILGGILIPRRDRDDEEMRP